MVGDVEGLKSGHGRIDSLALVATGKEDADVGLGFEVLENFGPGEGDDDVFAERAIEGEVFEVSWRTPRRRMVPAMGGGPLAGARGYGGGETDSLALAATGEG